ncbi:class I SAM-dependent RNA methyltransferase [Streptomyces sp. NRRL F-5135]|uniref:class I SAM-dependent RNA methyltransferase n=1 Tax=Streptomyces sp. NRRL F-5135 TaxID=1463858 RepID=UPI00099C0FC5|nr:TRAM domain-containing protein [Streptomyces sp. NRRL F-5135]
MHTEPQASPASSTSQDSPASPAAQESPGSLIGTQYEVEVGPVAHGGHCVARTDEGRVLFVRHALPGERVLARVTEGGEDSRYLRADAVEILDAAKDRVEAPCPYAGPGRCGGCDWQHAKPGAQRRFKGEVIAEQLRRLAGLTPEEAGWDGTVMPAPGDKLPAGEVPAWRSRVQYAVDESGRAGLRKHRSHDVEPVDHVAENDGGVHRVHGRDFVRERADGRTYRVGMGGFWQVHPQAPQLLVEAVMQGLLPRKGETALDLYCGVGLFAGAIADRVGDNGAVLGIESGRRAVEDARHNLREFPRVRIEQGKVDQILPRTGITEADLIVLDPPRAGAGRRTVAHLASLGARRIAYVACDPAALARDLAYFQEAGYRPRTLRAFDLFPMTHHVECVAILEPAAKGS